jgi:hypothetical protein
MLSCSIPLFQGALGLNLTVANNVFLMDPSVLSLAYAFLAPLDVLFFAHSWWQEAIESQAIDRVNRIGQKRNIRIYQLIAKNTVESKVLEIQGRKKELIKAVCLRYNVPSVGLAHKPGRPFLVLGAKRRKGNKRKHVFKVRCLSESQPKRGEHAHRNWCLDLIDLFR